MNQTSAQQWTALSALYEVADELPASALPAWLAELRRAGNPLLPALERMLAARAQVETDDFLGSLPQFHHALPERPRPSPRAPGQRVGPWRLVRPLGEGGMAEVWLAERDDGAFARRVAIKLPFVLDLRDDLAARFGREREILASLRHPHIAGLLDAGVTPQGQAWLALEFVDGEPLSLHCDRRRLTVPDRVALFRQVLLAVQHAHANLVIHRDLKPGNILVTPQGEARLLDFGIAKLLEAEGKAIAETELTRAAGRTLTPRYASPEQLSGRPLTTGCDLYALGVVLYELLCGERPYEMRAESAAQLEQAILESEPRAPSRRTGNEALAAERGVTARQLRRILSPELDAIVLRCLRKPVAQRYSSVDALLADVDRWLAGEAVLARAPGRWYRFAKFTLRHRLGMGLGAASLAALFAMTTVATLFGLHAREESARAVASRDFLLSIFRSADREKSRGADITARELLADGRRDVLVQLAGQPQLQTDLLAGIAAIQFDMGEYASADSTFEDVARIAANSDRPGVQALALTGQADNALRMGEMQRAGELLARARAVSVSSSRRDAVDVAARIALVGGWLDAFSGRADAARMAFERARTLAASVQGVAGIDALAALRGSIYVERSQLRYDRALALQHELERLVGSQPHPRPRELAELAFRSADLTYAAGRYAEVDATLARANADCAITLGARDQVCRRMILSQLRARMRMGFAGGSAETLRIADDVASDGEMPVARADALYLLMRLAAAAGPSERLDALVGRVEALVDAPTDGGVNGQFLDLADRVRLTVGLAEAALLTGRPELASHRAGQALGMQAAGHADARPTPWTAVAGLIQAVSVRLAGRPADALDGLMVARRDMCRAVGETHPMCRLFQLDVAVALADLGRTSDALDLVRHERPALAAALGVASPVLARLDAFEAQLSSRPASPGPGVSGGRAILPYVFI